MEILGVQTIVHMIPGTQILGIAKLGRGLQHAAMLLETVAVSDSRASLSASPTVSGGSMALTDPYAGPRGKRGLGGVPRLHC